MDILLNVITNEKIIEEITISGSKSESNRLLILQQLFPEISIANLSDSDDSVHLQQALSTKGSTIDIGHAGNCHAFFGWLFCLEKKQRGGINRF